MKKDKNDKLESLKSLIFPRIENLPEAKEYVNNVSKTAENYVRKVGKGIEKIGHFYRENPADAVGTAIAIGGTAYTGSQLGAALSDPDVRYDLGYGQVPKGTTILPSFHNPWNVFHPHPVLVPPESVWENPANVAGIVLPVVIPLATLGVEVTRFYLWKKSFREGLNVLKKKSENW